MLQVDFKFGQNDKMDFETLSIEVNIWGQNQILREDDKQYSITI